jgi:hypothetical protein
MLRVAFMRRYADLTPGRVIQFLSLLLVWCVPTMSRHVWRKMDSNAPYAVSIVVWHAAAVAWGLLDACCTSIDTGQAASAAVMAGGRAVCHPVMFLCTLHCVRGLL